MGPIMPFCPFCMRLGLMMRESGLELDTYLIDSRDKPEWFVRVGGKRAPRPRYSAHPGGFRKRNGRAVLTIQSRG
jgi:hypothetical protein